MTKAERNAYALRRYHDYLSYALEAVKWARQDRLDGLHEEAQWGLQSAAHYRRQAIEWLHRYRRTKA